VSLDIERLRNRAQHLLRDDRSGIASGKLLQDDRKFVAADARDGVAFADRLLQTPRDLPQELVADRMSERVVDDFEVVEVEEQHRQHRTAPLSQREGD
jgi:hypothetical protein